MELPWTSFLPLVYSTSLVLIELYLRVLDRRRRSSPYLSYKLYLLANFMLWLSCVALVAVALYRQAESVSIASFQVVWMQGSILGVFHLRILLFESTIAFKLWLLALGFAALVQATGAVLCVLNAASSLSTNWLQYSSVPILHSDWAMYYAVILSWIYWICSVRGTKSIHGFWKRITGNWRFLWLLFAPPCLSAFVGAIPFSLWYHPRTTFLINCTLQSLISTSTIIASDSSTTTVRSSQMSAGGHTTRSSIAWLSFGSQKDDRGTPTGEVVVEHQGDILESSSYRKL